MESYKITGKDYYHALGISRETSSEQINHAFQKLAKKYHPDANPSKEVREKFLEISEAYNVLSKPDERERYNRWYDEHIRKKEKQDPINPHIPASSSQRRTNGTKGGLKIRIETPDGRFLREEYI